MRFRLLSQDNQGNRTGVHLDGRVGRNGRFAKRVKPGEVIESNDPLDKLFKGKFVRLDGGPEPEPPATSEPKTGNAKRRSRE